LRWVPAGGRRASTKLAHAATTLSPVNRSVMSTLPEVHEEHESDRGAACAARLRARGKDPA
jgi:hypothetical protein